MLLTVESLHQPPFPTAASCTWTTYSPSQPFISPRSFHLRNIFSCDIKKKKKSHVLHANETNSSTREGQGPRRDDSAAKPTGLAAILSTVRGPGRVGVSGRAPRSRAPPRFRLHLSSRPKNLAKPRARPPASRRSRARPRRTQRVAPPRGTRASPGLGPLSPAPSVPEGAGRRGHRLSRYPTGSHVGSAAQ